MFSVIVIGRRGRGTNATFTVRRISYGEGVERVFPVHSPRIDRVEVERQGKVRRAKHLPPPAHRQARHPRETEGHATSRQGLSGCESV